MNTSKKTTYYYDAENDKLVSRKELLADYETNHKADYEEDELTFSNYLKDCTTGNGMLTALTVNKDLSPETIEKMYQTEDPYQLKNADIFTLEDYVQAINLAELDSIISGLLSRIDELEA